MENDQISALRDVFAATFAYLTAPKEQAVLRRIDLCETLGQLICALEGLLPDDGELEQALEDDSRSDDTPLPDNVILLRPRASQWSEPTKGDGR